LSPSLVLVHKSYDDVLIAKDRVGYVSRVRQHAGNAES
jgi:hypothetical protein